MELLNHKVFFNDEFFGSRIYNTLAQEEYFFDKESTNLIKKIYSGSFIDTPAINIIKNDLIKKGLLTSDISYIQHKKCKGLSSPTRVSINISQKCNLRCRHCLSDSGEITSKELTKKELFGLIDKMRQAGSFYFAIGGGEPLMREDLFEVIKYARKNYIAASIITNSLLVTNEIAKKLNDLKVKTVTVSIDGREAHHDQNRGQGNFKKAIEKIKILRKYLKYTKLAMRTTVNSFNINDCDYLIKLAEKLNFDFIRLTPILPLGRANEYPEMFITQDQYISFLKKAVNVQSNIKVILPNQENDKKILIESDNFGCHCGKETCWITETGDFYPCIFFGKNYLAGNIRKQDFSKLWEKSKKMVTLCGNEICKNCGNYGNCRGGCRARALAICKDMNAVDPLCPLKKNQPIKNKFSRAPYQVLIFPFIKERDKIFYAIFKRSDLNFWQGISGGGEGNESPLEAVQREIWEEIKIKQDAYKLIRLSSMATIPADNIKGQKWGEVIMIPEFSFGLEAKSKKLSLGEEHTEYLWLEFDQAIEKLKYDSNKSALWELDQRLKNKNIGGIEKNIETIKKYLD